MKLSIITICYNDKAGLEKTIQSVISQTYMDFEWIIIDGNSKDGTVELIQETEFQLSTICSQLQLYWKSEPDNGIYNAMNKGIIQAHGEYLLFLNSGDCLYNKDTLKMIVSLLIDKDIYVGDIVNDYNGTFKTIKFPRELTPRIILNQLIFKLIPHQASFIRRDVFERYGMYREDLDIASDWYLFYVALVLNGATVETIPEIISLYDTTGISSKGPDHVDERLSGQDIIPCQKELYCFYRSNFEIVDAIQSTWIGRFFIRVYFSFYRWFKK